MRNLVFVSAVAFVLTPLTAAPTSAQVQQQQQQNVKNARDPNEVVCEKQEEIGSRIATKRVCMTRSQWAEQRRLDRQDVEKAQIDRPMSSPQ